MKEIINSYCWEKEKQVLTYKEHKIPGLKNLAHHNMSTSFQTDPFHFHSEIIEIHCMMKGERVVYLEEGENITRHIIYGNEVFLTYPYEIHQNGDSSQSPCEFYAFQIDLRNRNHLLFLDEEHSIYLSNLLLNLRNRHLQLSSPNISLLRKSFNLFSSSEPHDIKLGVATLCCFLFNLQYMLPVEHGALNFSDKNIQKAVEYISENLTSVISLEHLAKLSGYSVSRFKTKFKSETGIPPAEFINLQKIKFAKTLLETTDISITELSYKLAFASSNYFSSVFKKFLNITPQQYKKNFRSSKK